MPTVHSHVTEIGQALKFWTLSFLAAGLTLLNSCSDSRPVRVRYNAERMMYEAEKLLRSAPASTQLPDSPELRSRYGELAAYCLSGLDSMDQRHDSVEFSQVSLLAFRSTTRLSQMLFADRQYDSCVVLLRRLQAKVPLPRLEAAATVVNYGQALQGAGRWDSARAAYNRALAMVSPPLAPTGEVLFSVFNLPMHIYRVLARTRDSVAARMQFDQAEQYYRSLLSAYPSSRLAISSHANLAGLYAAAKRYRQSIDELRQLVDSSGQVNPEAGIRIGDTYAGQLGQLDSALVVYDDVLAHLSGPDTAGRPILIYKKAMVQLQKKDYEETRRLLAELDRSYHGYYAANPTAQFAKARSFELEGNWARAETEFRFLIENYPNSEEAMSTFLYLADNFQKQGRADEAERWLQRADTYYSDMAIRGSGTPLQAMAMTYQAELARRKQDWRAAATSLTKIFDLFPQTPIGQRSLVNAAGMYREKLGNQAAADSLMELLRRSLTRVDQPSEGQDL